MEIIILLIVIASFSYAVYKMFKGNVYTKVGVNIFFDNLGIYILSLLIPLVGFIAGAINLTKDESYKKSIGVNCIVLGIVSTILGYILITK